MKRLWFMLMILGGSWLQARVEQVSFYPDRLFIENKGQWPDEVLFLTRLGNLDIWITRKGLNYTFFAPPKPQTHRNNKAFKDKTTYVQEMSATVLGHRIRMDYLHANLNPIGEGKQKQEGYLNFCIGKSSDGCVSYVSLYKEVIVRNVYDGVDIRYYYEGNHLRYDYIVSAGVLPSVIQFCLRGQYSAYQKGQNIIFTTRFGEVSLADLHTYQCGMPLNSGFVRKGDTWQIAVEQYNPTEPLIIDPLVYSTYIGGNDDEEAYSITVDGSGNAYIAGRTFSLNYDTTAGAFQTTLKGSIDAFITKLNPNGTSLIYSTYLGGSNEEAAYAISLDEAGNAYVTGITSSNDYPVTSSVIQNQYGGGMYDIFVTQLSPNGTSILYSTYLGGNDWDEARSIVVKGTGNVYLTGFTYSGDYDITSSVFQPGHEGPPFGTDAFVTHLNTSTNQLLYSTYLGGNGMDEAYSIAVDENGNAYVTGQTTSSDYDTTAGALQTTYGGGPYDLFVTKLNPNGTALLYSTYLGGNDFDIGRGIVIDATGNAYLTGQTNSTNYPTTSSAFSTTGGTWDAFVSKLNPTGDSLIYSTFLPGNGDEIGNSIAIDSLENIYLTGSTTSNHYPVTNGAVQFTLDGGTDVFVSQLNPTGTTLLYSTYLGGNNDEEGLGIALDPNGNVYVTGKVWSTNYEVTQNAFQPNHGGGFYDGFVTKLCVKAMMSVSGPSATPTVCIHTPIPIITHTTVGATGIGTPTGLPPGVTASFHSDTIIISGTPTATDTFHYTIPLLGGCGNVNATGTIIVDACTDREIALNANFLAYPNPTNGSFTIETEHGGEFEVIDLTGKVLQVISFQEPRRTVQVSLPAGMYFLRDTQTGTSVKIVVE